MAMKKVPFKGTGFGWFPMMKHFVGNIHHPGLFFHMSSSPELRLYMTLMAESDNAGSHSFELTNEHLREFAGLDRTTLNIARNKLDALDLIRFEKTSKQSYQYEILGDGGRSMSHKIAESVKRDNTYFIPPTEEEAA
jgi:hypothetical protein